MKILMHYQDWGNRWIPYIKKELSRYDLTMTCTNERNELFKLSKEADVLFSMWANEVVWFWSNVFPEKKIISYLRRYELFNDNIFKKTKWDKVDALIFVNSVIKDLFNNRVNDKSIKEYLIYNGLDLNEFLMDTEYRTGKKIAMVCTIKQIKNLPLACQVLLELPKEYKIYHIGKNIGGVGVNELFYYIDGLGLGDRFIFEGKIKPSEVSYWMNDKDYILSTSINEGNPVNVLEGMAMGLKPVVHNWPGAKDQFDKQYMFSTAQEAASIITDPELNPNLYRKMVKYDYGLAWYDQLHNVIEELG